MMDGVLPPEARQRMLQAFGCTAAEAAMVDEHALAEAQRAFDYGLKVVRTLTPAHLHPLAGAAYVGALRHLISNYRAGLAQQAGQTRQ